MDVFFANFSRKNPPRKLDINQSILTLVDSQTAISLLIFLINPLKFVIIIKRKFFYFHIYFMQIFPMEIFRVNSAYKLPASSVIIPIIKLI